MDIAFPNVGRPGTTSPVRHKHNSLKYSLELTRILLLIICLIIATTGNAAAQEINYSAKAVPLRDVLSAIKKQSGYVFFYDHQTLQTFKPVTFSVKAASLRQTLDAALAGLPLKYTIENKTVFITRHNNAPPAQTPTQAVTTHRVTGRVTDTNGNPLAGATVGVKGSKTGTVTDGNGNYSLDVPGHDAILVFTMIGFQRKEIAPNGQSALDVSLQLAVADIVTVDVVGSTGYQKIPRERVTGAFDVVSSKQLDTRIQTNVIERLEGMVPGLMMINGKDAGGANSDALSIRGVSTLYGTKRPLIVIDNFPFDGTMEAINPNDVASITVLKDAAAASIWGARAANGVIVITTRNARKGKINFSYSNNFQFEPKPNLNYLDRLSAKDDIFVNRQLLTPNYEQRVIWTASGFSKFERLYMDSVAGRISPATYAHRVDSLGNLDNASQIKDLLMQSPFTQNHSLSFNGGNDNSQYYGSLRYTDTRGFRMKDFNQNISILLKAMFTITPKLSFNVSTNLLYGDGTIGAVDPVAIYRYKPYQPLQDATGNPLVLNVNTDPNNQNNSNEYTIAQRIAWGLEDEAYYPIKELERTRQTTKNAYNRIQAELKYNLWKGIDINISYQLEKSYNYDKLYAQPDAAQLVKEINDYITPQRDAAGEIITNVDGSLRNPTYNLPKGGKLREIRNDFSAYSLRGMINVNRKIGADHEIAAVAGLERRQTKSTGNQIVKYGYDDNTLQYIDLDVQRLKDISDNLQSITSPFTGITDRFTYQEDRFVSTFANAAYTWRNKYVASGSARMDATNLFGTDPRYRNRPMWSAGLSWILSNEKFLQASSLVSHLQLRATYGLNGNIPKNTGPFMIAEAGTNYFNNLPSNNITTPANNELRWEKTAVTNIGIDFNLLNGTISGKADYYRRKSTDLLGEQQINPTLGFLNATLNTAGMDNNGWELQMTTRNIHNRKFEWNTTVSFAQNRSSITEIALSSNYNSPRDLAANAPYVKGKPYGAMYSFRFGGLSPDKGQIQLLDPTGKIAPDEFYYDMDMVYFTGNTRPVNNGAVTNAFRYRNIDLSFMFIFYGGHKARQRTPAAYTGVDSYDARLATAWKQPGDEQHTSIPNVVRDNSAYYATVYYGNYLDANVFNASYIKLRDVSLRYTFGPRLLSALKFVQRLQLTANARNLLTFHSNKLGIDPEAFANGARIMPVMPTYAFGINLDF